MRKLFVLPIIIAGLMLNSDAFSAAPARGTRGNSNNAAAATSAKKSAGGAPVSARAAARGGVKKTTGTASTGSAGKTTTAAATSAKPSAGKPNGARAAATQKVINTGTKVATKTDNTTVSQECQDAYFGCMDSLCMIDNATGGRCMCSSKIDELNKIQEEIARLDEQSYIMATEGVERLKMGENADEILARAKSAGDIAAGKKQEENNSKKARTLDLSAWNNAVFDDDDDVFEVDTSATDALQNKTGDELYKLSIKMCASQVPNQCAKSASMLQMMYAQKIKSDCTAYENSLKQQKNASTQKLQTAQKALRDTALEEFQNENKYDLGQCIVRFGECMQTTAGCGEDYTGCVTLAAAENVKSSAQTKTDKAKNKKSKQTTIKGAVSSITLAASTIDQMMAKKPLCESVLKQCKKVQDKVWDAFMANVAPTLKSAELIAEDNLRSNCITDVSECFQKACKENMDPKNPDGSYDMCLSDPMLVVDLCKVKLEPCIEATGGTLGSEASIKSSRLWAGVTARLSAMRVDACTAEVKACLMSDDACGADYSKCVGLDTNSIGNLCPAAKLTACMKKNDETTVRDYVAEVAQGIALNIDNNMLTTCQKAVTKAMATYCGDESSCPNVSVSPSLFQGKVKVEACKKGDSDTLTCFADVYKFGADEVIGGDVTPYVTGRLDLSMVTAGDMTPIDEKESSLEGDSFTGAFTYGDDNEKTSRKETEGYNHTAKDLKFVVDALNTAYRSKLQQVANDPTVTYCISGRKVQGFNDKTFGGKKTGEGDDATMDKVARFPGLLNTASLTIRETLMNSVLDVYDKEVKNVIENDFDKVSSAIAKRVADISAEKEAMQDAANYAKCHANDDHANFSHKWGRSGTWSIEGSYDANTNICTTTKKNYSCEKYVPPYCWRWNTTGVVDGTPSITQMPHWVRGGTEKVE